MTKYFKVTCGCINVFVIVIKLIQFHSTFDIYLLRYNTHLFPRTISIIAPNIEMSLTLPN